MLDLAALSSVTHGAFAVDVTVSRSGDADRTERAVFHFGRTEWHSHSGSQQVALDAVSVLESVDIAPGDTIACDDTSVVPAAASWTVADRIPSDGDRHIHTWRIVEEL